MTEALPIFKYYPDPIATGTVVASDTVCISCNRARGYIYTGPAYTEAEIIDEICPWCIADGTAHTKLDVDFFDDVGVGGGGTWDDVPDTVVREIVERTPSFTGWQQERWFTCCQDAAAFLGRAGRKELEAYGEQAEEAIRREIRLAMPSEHYDRDAYFDALDAEGAPTAYLFRCLHCGKFGGYADTNWGAEKQRG